MRLNPGDIVRSTDERDEEEHRFVVIEAGIPHQGGTVAKVAALYTVPVYRLESNLLQPED